MCDMEYSFCCLCTWIEYRGMVEPQGLDADGMLVVPLRDMYRNVVDILKYRVSNLNFIMQRMKQEI